MPVVGFLWGSPLQRQITKLGLREMRVVLQWGLLSNSVMSD